jgi:sugar porter (SP) family MFS transporter
MQSKFYVYKIAFIVSIGGLLLGISANVSGASEFYRSYFDLKIGSFLEGLGVSIAMLATFIGNFNAGAISDKMGRKRALFLAAFLFSFCTLGSGLATNYTFFLITRFIGGLGIGISLLVVPMFIAEFSPQDKRGFLVSFNQLNVGIGFLLAYLLNSAVVKNVADPDVTWRWMLGVGFVFPAVYMVLLQFVPESPRWLIGQGKVDEARKILTKIGGEAHAQKELEEILRATGEGGLQEKQSYRKLWPVLFGKPLRLILLVGLSVAFFQMASGFNSVMFFVPRIFRMAGFGTGSFFMSNLVGITMVVMTVVSMFLIDRLGRKPLLLIGVSVMAVSILVSAWAFNASSYTIENQGITSITASIKDPQEKQIIADVLEKMKVNSKNKEVAFFTAFKNEISVRVNNAELSEKIYSEQIAGIKDRSQFSPHALSALCSFAVMSRLRVCQTKNYNDKKLANIATNLTPLEKALYLAGIEMPERLDIESKQILKQGHEEIANEYINDSLYEGKFGLSPRDLKYIIFKLSSLHLNVSYVEVLDYLQELIQKKSEYDFLNMAAQADYHNPGRYIEMIKDYNLNIFDHELRTALGLIDDRSYEDYIRRYVENINALNKGEKIKNVAMGKFVDPDDFFIKEFELAIGLKEDAKNYRSLLLSKLGAYSLDNRGKQIVYTSVFPDLVDSLQESYRSEQKKVIQNISRNIVFFEAEFDKTIDPSQSSPLSDDNRSQIKSVLISLEKLFGYTEGAAMSLIKFLIKERY